MPHFTYILKCADTTLYVGYTKDVAKRVATHNTGKAGAKYTKARRPVVLLYSEKHRTLSAALKREHAIKKLSRAEKLALIQSQSSN
jgi:putative endonuclease